MRTSTASRKPSMRSGAGSETLAQKAYDALEEMILTLQLEPGSVITEQSLISRTGLGRTPLREALLRLGREKLVDVLPRRGIKVADISVAQYLSLLEVRRVLDGLIAQKAARRATREQREELRRIAGLMEQEAARKHLAEFMRLDRTFDALLEAAARAPFAVNAVKPLHAHSRRFWYSFRHNGDLAKAAGLHARLMRAVAGGNEKDARKASDNLLDYLERFTRQALEIL